MRDTGGKQHLNVQNGKTARSQYCFMTVATVGIKVDELCDIIAVVEQLLVDNLYGSVLKLRKLTSVLALIDMSGGSLPLQCREC